MPMKVFQKYIIPSQTNLCISEFVPAIRLSKSTIKLYHLLACDLYCNYKLLAIHQHGKLLHLLDVQAHHMECALLNKYTTPDETIYKSSICIYA